MNRNPVTISRIAWYYENPRSIDVIVECRDEKSDEYHRTLQIRIPASKLERSLTRMKPVKVSS